MSKYSEKRDRRILANAPPPEPTDAFSIIPDASLRRYFRARAGLYGMTQMLHRQLKIDVGKDAFVKMQNGRQRMIHIVVTSQNAEALGELARELCKERQRVDVWSSDCGGRMKAVVVKLLENSFPSARLPVLGLLVRPKPHDRPVMREWRRTGVFVASTQGVIV